MKKLLILLLAITLLICTFASCKGNRSGDEADRTSESVSETTTEAITSEADTTTTSDSSSATNQEIDIDYLLNPENWPGYNPNYDPNAGKYTINKVGNDWYLKFDSYGPEAMFSDQIIPTFQFSTMAELKDALNTLTAANRDYIKMNWEKNEHGVKVINFDDLYSTTVPTGIIRSDKIYWEMDSYYFYIKLADSDKKYYDGKVNMITDEDYASISGSDVFEGIEPITESGKTAKIKSAKTLKDGAYVYNYYALIQASDVYCYITLKTSKPLDSTDIFLDFDFVKYEEE